MLLTESKISDILLCFISKTTFPVLILLANKINMDLIEKHHLPHVMTCNFTMGFLKRFFFSKFSTWHVSYYKKILPFLPGRNLISHDCSSLTDWDLISPETVFALPWFHMFPLHHSPIFGKDQSQTPCIEGYVLPGCCEQPDPGAHSCVLKGRSCRRLFPAACSQAAQG